MDVRATFPLACVARTRSCTPIRRGATHEYQPEVLASFSIEVGSRAGRCSDMRQPRVEQRSLGAGESIEGRDEIPGSAEQGPEMQQLHAVRRARQLQGCRGKDQPRWLLHCMGQEGITHYEEITVPIWRKR